MALAAIVAALALGGTSGQPAIAESDELEKYLVFDQLDYAYNYAQCTAYGDSGLARAVWSAYECYPPPHHATTTRVELWVDWNA